MRHAARIALRVLRISLLSIAALILLAFVLVQAQQHLFRHRAERLLADFQSIRLHQSTWADAQVLMQRWGAWGHYDGTCGEAECVYRIELGDAASGWVGKLAGGSDGLRFRIVERSYELLGGRDGAMVVSFLLQDGVIWRSGIELMVGATPRADYGYMIFLKAHASDSLRDSWVGDEEQLARHPNYKAHRPGACEGCLAAEVTFTPYIAPSTLRELTAYNLSCLTRLVHSCVNLPDVLPIAHDWHFYPETEGEAKPPAKPATPKACDAPLYALGRDADTVFVVDVLSRGARGVFTFIPRATDRRTRDRYSESPRHSQRQHSMDGSSGDQGSALRL